MPAIQKREEEERWFSGDPLGPGELEQILIPYPSQEMSSYPVSSRVNNPASGDDELLIRPLPTL
jgi:putative SOS response-associated peptidase YedK